MPDPSPLCDDSAASSFPRTQWTRVLKVIQEGEGEAAWGALVAFCEAYRPAVYAFFRRNGYSHEVAEDWTQDFFATRIHARWDDREGFLFRADREKAPRFRSFLSHVLWDHLKERVRREKTVRAGGKVVWTALEGLDPGDPEAEMRLRQAASEELDRQIALEVIRRAAGQTTRSHYLLEHFRGELSQAEAAGRLGISEEAFKQAYFRFRSRFPAQLRREVALLAGPGAGDIDEEIRYLMSQFSRSSS